MNIFGSPYNRGCFKKFSVDTSQGFGARLNLGGRDIPNSNSDPFVVVGFNMQKEEATAIMRCFNDTSFIYAFGDNIEQSLLAVKVMALMPAEGQGASVGTMLDLYSKNRLSNASQGQPNLSLYYGNSNAALMGYLLGMGSATVSSEYGFQSFDLKVLLTSI